MKFSETLRKEIARMAIRDVILDKKQFETLNDLNTAFVLGKEEKTFKAIMTLKDFSQDDQNLWKEFLNGLGLEPDKVNNLGQVSYEEYSLKYFSFPVLCKEKNSLSFVIGSDAKGYSSTKIPFEVDTEKRQMFLRNGKKVIPVYFDKGTYKNTAGEEVAYPVLLIPVGKDLIFRCKVMIKQKPDDVKKIDPEVDYFNYTTFSVACQSYDKETIFNFIQPQYTTTTGISISYLFRDFFINNTFPPKGIALLITGVKYLPKGKFGESAIFNTNFDLAWIAGEAGVTLDEFQTYQGSKEQGLTPVSSNEVGAIWFNEGQTAFEQGKVYLKQGKIPTDEKPWVLWVKSKNLNTGNPEQVPEHLLSVGVPAIPTVKNSMPKGLLKASA